MVGGAQVSEHESAPSTCQVRFVVLSGMVSRGVSASSVALSGAGSLVIGAVSVRRFPVAAAGGTVTVMFAVPGARSATTGVNPNWMLSIAASSPLPSGAAV